MPTTPKVYSNIEQIPVQKKEQPSVNEPIKNKVLKDLEENSLQQVWKQLRLPKSLSGIEVVKSGPGNANVLLSSEDQIPDFEQQKQSILSILREKLENDLIELDYQIKENRVKTIEITPEDRFAELAQQNPALIELEKRFRLEMIKAEETKN